MGSSDVQTRNAATLKVVKERMRSVNNIKKITKAMKMVAAAKVRGDIRRLEAGLPFAQPVQNLLQRLPHEEKGGSITYLALTSDKGLCGGVNSFVNKQVRLGTIEEEAKGNAVKIQIVGGKGVAGLKRLFADRFTHSFEEVTKEPWNYYTSSIIAERVTAAEPNRLKLVYNRFRNMAAYETEVVNVVTKNDAKTMDKAEWSKAMDVYSFEPSIFEVWDDLHEFYYGAMLYSHYLNNAVSEQSSRMAAMENASKNAGEMLDKLTLIYNRVRQAKITTELCEIISGASAV